MTGTKIHQILVEQYNFAGCVQTVRRYIAAAELRCKEVYYKLDFRPVPRLRLTGAKRW